MRVPSVQLTLIKEFHNAQQPLSELKVNHSELKAKALSNPTVKAACDEIAPGFALMREMLNDPIRQTPEVSVSHLMNNPWLEIPLSGSEFHMSLPTIA